MERIRLWTNKGKRINELYRKSKAEGLTDVEKKEQKILRQEYIDAFKRNLRSQLNNIDVEEKTTVQSSIWERNLEQSGTLENRCYAPETG